MFTSLFKSKAHLPKLSLDEGKIEQVLNNLISNAVKFSQPGAAVEVRAGVQDSGVTFRFRIRGRAFPKPNATSYFNLLAGPASEPAPANAARGSAWSFPGKSWKDTEATFGWKAERPGLRVFL